jgi:hypothetical protein
MGKNTSKKNIQKLKEYFIQKDANTQSDGRPINQVRGKS